MLSIILPVAGNQVSAAALIALGFFVGFLGGLFGVGGGFLITPMLNAAFSISYPIAIGSSLAQMTGLAASATIRHYSHGNVNIRLALLLILGSIFGVRLGAGLVETLKQAGEIVIFEKHISAVDFYIPIAYILILLYIGIAIFRESAGALRKSKENSEAKTRIAAAVKKLSLPPRIALSGHSNHIISIWIILFIGFITGILSGFMGVGGGCILTPLLIYLLGIPTLAAIGTGLFLVIFISIQGTFFHALAGNVDIVLVALMLSGSVIGAQLGAITSSRISAQRIRYLFSIIIFVGAIIVAVKLILKLT